MTQFVVGRYINAHMDPRHTLVRACCEHASSDDKITADWKYANLILPPPDSRPKIRKAALVKSFFPLRMTEVQDYVRLFAPFRHLSAARWYKTAPRDIKGNRLPLPRKVHRRWSGIIFPLTRNSLLLIDRPRVSFLSPSRAFRIHRLYGVEERRRREKENVKRTKLGGAFSR